MNSVFKIVFVSFLMMGPLAFGQQTFPDSWEGNYKGELQLFGVDSVSMKLTMKLDVMKKSDSVYQWKMTYDFRGKEDIRDYELKVIDIEKGHYLVDEKNTILIDGYYKTGIFTSFFHVMDAFIITTYTKHNSDLIFELISASGKNATVTGNEKFDGEAIPEVKSYLVNGRQKAILKKI